MAYATALSTLSHSLPSPKANATRLLVLRSASDYTYPPAHTELRSWFFGDVGGNGARTLGPSPHPQPSPSPITLTPHPSPLTLTDHPRRLEDAMAELSVGTPTGATALEKLTATLRDHRRVRRLADSMRDDLNLAASELQIKQIKGVSDGGKLEERFHAVMAAVRRGAERERLLNEGLKRQHSSLHHAYHRCKEVEAELARSVGAAAEQREALVRSSLHALQQLRTHLGAIHAIRPEVRHPLLPSHWRRGPRSPALSPPLRDLPPDLPPVISCLACDLPPCDLPGDASSGRGPQDHQAANTHAGGATSRTLPVRLATKPGGASKDNGWHHEWSPHRADNRPSAASFAFVALAAIATQAQGASPNSNSNPNPNVPDRTSPSPFTLTLHPHPRPSPSTLTLHPHLNRGRLRRPVHWQHCEWRSWRDLPRSTRRLAAQQRRRDVHARSQCLRGPRLVCCGHLLQVRLPTARVRLKSCSAHPPTD